MSKYKKNLEKINEVSETIKALENQRTTSDRDKTGLYWGGKMGSTHNRTMMFFETDLHVGYYGNSSVSDYSSDFAAAEIAKTLNSLKEEIIVRTTERLKKEKQKLAKEIKEEALKIIEMCEGEEK